MTQEGASAKFEGVRVSAWAIWKVAWVTLFRAAFWRASFTALSLLSMPMIFFA